MVVDDDTCCREALRLLLEHQGFEVETACDGGVAARLIESSAFDLVITDLDMPVMNGLLLIRHLRALSDCAGLPIVLLTAAPPGDPRLREAVGMPRVSAHRKGGKASEVTALAREMLSAA
ncbi:MAG TPA: response regulator [Candidatus Dormibacteraeota bacterium]|nr:response regulator [Candidatus Dormibacteraeota bacterium]